jgi:hypothetical protein
VRDQTLDDLHAGPVMSKAGGPTDDVELVIVDLARDGFRSVLDEPRRDGSAEPFGCAWRNRSRAASSDACSAFSHRLASLRR